MEHIWVRSTNCFRSWRRTPAAPLWSALRDCRWRLTVAIVTFAALLLSATISPAQTCLHGPTESLEQRLRRDAAIRFAQQVNEAQERLRTQNRKFGHLDELSLVASAPVGFVPRLTVDHWSYSIVLKDLFDNCGFMIFSDQDGVIYEGHPVAAARRPVTAKTFGSDTVGPKAPRSQSTNPVPSDERKLGFLMTHTATDKLHIRTIECPVCHSHGADIHHDILSSLLYFCQRWQHEWQIDPAEEPGRSGP